MVPGGESADESVAAVLLLNVAYEMLAFEKCLVTTLLTAGMRSLPRMRVHVVSEVNRTAKTLVTAGMGARMDLRAWPALGPALALTRSGGKGSGGDGLGVVSEGWSRGSRRSIGILVSVPGGVVVFVREASSLYEAQQDVLRCTLSLGGLSIFRRRC